MNDQWQQSKNVTHDKSVWVGIEATSAIGLELCGFASFFCSWGRILVRFERNWIFLNSRNQFLKKQNIHRFWLRILYLRNSQLFQALEIYMKLGDGTQREHTNSSKCPTIQVSITALGTSEIRDSSSVVENSFNFLVFFGPGFPWRYTFRQNLCKQGWFFDLITWKWLELHLSSTLSSLMHHLYDPF